MSQNVIDRISHESDSYWSPYDAQGYYHLPPAPANFGSKTVLPVPNAEVVIEEILFSQTQENVQGGYEEQGDDFLACYLPFFHNAEHWGIYFDVARMSDYVKRNSFGDDESLILKTLHHERFHFLVEFFGAYRESIHKFPRGNQIYELYKRANPQKAILVEEAMCNAYALTRRYPAKVNGLKPKQIQLELANICDQAPAGYRDYWQVCDSQAKRSLAKPFSPKLSKNQFNNSVAVLLDEIIRPAPINFKAFLTTVVARSPLHVKALLLSEHQLSRIPMYLIYPAGHNGLAQFQTPRIKLARFYKYLESKHGVVYSEGSSHAKLRQPSTGKKLNGWKRKNSKADLLPYQIKQAAEWLGVTPDALAYDLESFVR